MSAGDWCLVVLLALGVAVAVCGVAGVLFKGVSFKRGEIMAVLHIFRGLPGSGKTTAARKLAAETGAILIEPDALLVEDGSYVYTPEIYATAKRVAKRLVTEVAMWGADMIYADVLPKRVDVITVKEYALNYERNYKLVVHDLKITVEESLKRNRHNVRREDIERMAREWEDWEE